MKTCRVFISGFVQGIGFRQFVKKEAVKLDLTGYVKNLPDGRVEILIQGDKESIDRLVKHSEKGPFLSEVKNTTVDWIDSAPKFDGFEIAR